jgi:glycerol uptake operon antiterminator
MLTRFRGPLPKLLGQYKIIPMIEDRSHFAMALASFQANVLFLRHCNLFELTPLLAQADRLGKAIYVNVDHIDGIHPDTAGLRYLAEACHVVGVLSNHAKTLALAKEFELETIQRIFAADSSGLEMALESIDTRTVDLLDFSPALAIPYVIPLLDAPLPLPFVAFGLVHTAQQVREVLRCGAVGVAVNRPELWQ